MPDQPLLKRYINLTSDESSALDDIDSILPVTIYERLATAIKDARDKAGALSQSPSLETIQRHGAVTIDGDRGTGKTSVLVNLGRYLEKYHQDLNTDVYVLKPIDPTLLEDGESLFMHVVIAAILSDTKVMDLQRANPYGAKDLQQALQELSTALESIEAQNQTFRGMDRLRSIVDTRTLAAKVHNFFLKTLALLGKKLLIIPIDDVDTSLNRAFENLEVIRRYLVSPRVLPIISGNLQLYHQVVWRDFHGRLTKDSRYREEEAYETALDLATEYQRKILPIPLRLQMPTVSDYLQDQSIWLKLGSQEMMSLPNFYAWLKLFLGGPVNRRDGNDLDLGIQSTRSLTQLLRHCAGLIANLPEAVRTAQTPIDAQRAWQMPAVAPEAIREFATRYKQEKKSMSRNYSAAYRVFSEKNKNLIDINLINSSAHSLAIYHKRDLLNYFISEYNNPSAIFNLIAMEHWESAQFPDDSGSVHSIFDTPLFQPLEQDLPVYHPLKKPYSLSGWGDHIRKSDFISTELKLNTDNLKVIYPYSFPEIGQPITKDAYKKDDSYEYNFLLDLFLSDSINKFGNDINSIKSGRVIEIIIASFIGELSPEYILETMIKPPYYSFDNLKNSKIKNDKSQIIEDPDEIDDDHDSNSIIEIEHGKIIDKLCKDIHEWRERNNVTNATIPSPWNMLLITNRVFSKLNSTKPSIIQNKNDITYEFYRIINSIWNEFGCTEKGYIFGLDESVDTKPIESSTNFPNRSQAQANIIPFYNLAAGVDEQNRRTAYGKLTRSMTYALHDHPLVKMIYNTYEEKIKNDPIPEHVTDILLYNNLIESLIRVGGAVKADKLIDEYCKKLNINKDSISIETLTYARSKVNNKSNQYKYLSLAISKNRKDNA